MPGMWANVLGTNKEVTAASVNVSGTWKAVVGGWVNVSGTWKRIFATLSASASPSIVSGTLVFNPDPFPGSYQGLSDATTATPSGGSGSYNYAWEVQSESGGTLTFNNGSSASTDINGSNTTGNPISGSVRCLVTDTGTGATAYTNSVSVGFS